MCQRAQEKKDAEVRTELLDAMAGWVMTSARGRKIEPNRLSVSGPGRKARSVRNNYAEFRRAFLAMLIDFFKSSSKRAASRPSCSGTRARYFPSACDAASALPLMERTRARLK